MAYDGRLPPLRAFPENGPILVSKWWGAEDGQDLSLTQRK